MVATPEPEHRTRGFCFLSRALRPVLAALACVPGVGQAFDHSHARFDALLKTIVVATPGVPATRVKYAALKANPAPLESYVESLAAVTPAQARAFTRDERLAFLINAYNAQTLSLVTRNYPVASIRRIGGLFQSPWKIRFIDLLGEKRSLDDVEHTLIRKNFDEPRIHFAVNCASKGCPALRADAYAARSLDSQLEEAACAFLADSRENRYEPSSHTLHLSSIFKWYGEDFEKAVQSDQAGQTGAVAFAVNRMPLADADKARIKAAPPKVKYVDYDWSLNAAE